MTNYKGLTITEVANGAFVAYDDDELYFDSVTKAKDFINGVA